MGLLRQKEVDLLQFVDRKVIRRSSGFAVNLHEKRAVNSDKGKSGLWAKVLYLVFCSGSSGRV
jgi:hypothetical protein